MDLVTNCFVCTLTLCVWPRQLFIRTFVIPGVTSAAHLEHRSPSLPAAQMQMLSMHVMLHAGNAGGGDGVSQALLAESEYEGEIVTLQPEVEDPSVLDWENIGVCIYKVGAVCWLHSNIKLPRQVLACVGCCRPCFQGSPAAPLCSASCPMWHSALPDLNHACFTAPSIVRGQTAAEVGHIADSCWLPSVPCHTMFWFVAFQLA